jgi:hypothetical protein
MTGLKQRCGTVAAATKATGESRHKEAAIQPGMSQEHNPSQLVEPRFTPVTSAGRQPGATAAERKRLQRKRALIYERDDWQLFLDPATLPQKAGCDPFYLNQIVLKELVDNGLDTGADVLAGIQRWPVGCPR